MTRPVLVTAFEPFMSGWPDVMGLVRKHLLRRNASLDVMRLLQAREDMAGCDFRVLAVADEGEQQLMEALEVLDPVGLVSMGEHGRLPHEAVNLEPFAVDAPVCRGGDGSRYRAIDSPFAARYAAECGRGLISEIGTYYCNRIYRAGLRWAAGHGQRPVAFLHVPVFGRRARHAEQAAEVISAVKRDGG